MAPHVEPGQAMNIEQSPDLSVFCRAVELATPAERAAYLEQACRNNPALRVRVDALLRAHDEAGRFLDSGLSASGAPTVTTAPAAEAPGMMIGPYKLREVLGEGGMGTVYVAEQEKPIHRKVALKVIKPGMDSKEVIARFEAERQALALMDHQHIAKVLDAGTTELGRPYFVMELVRGIAITDYCDQAGLNPRERLELFVQVCRAVQHAHQKGVIHRDLKPSNVLVTRPSPGAPGVPKIIDFGVAKAINQRLTEHTVYTRHAQMVGTPLYMSPEQAELTALDIDTRSDVYSLGVLLYELLTGTTPITKETMSNIDFDEMRRMIREDEPPRPSQRISTLARETLATVASQRGVEERQFSRLLRGELDWIVMKALDKERSRRYGSADALASDLQRYLDDQPVEAFPPSRIYLLRKFLHRHRTGMVISSVLLAAALLAAVGGSWVVLDRTMRRAETERAVSRAWDEADQWENLRRWRDAMSAAKLAVDLVVERSGDDELRRRATRRRDFLELVVRLEDIQQQGGVPGKELVFGSPERVDALYAQSFRDYGLDIDELEPAEFVQRIPDGPIRRELAGTLDDWAFQRRLWRRRSKLSDDRPWQRVLDAARAADPSPAHNRLRDLFSSLDYRTYTYSTGIKEQEAGIAAEAAKLALDLHPYSYRLLMHLPRFDFDGFLRAQQKRHPENFSINWHLAVNLSLRATPGATTLSPAQIRAQLDEAIGYLRAVLAVKPDNPIALSSLGEAMLKRAWSDQTLDEAIDYLQRSVEINPKVENSQRNLGAALARRGRLDEAADAYRNAIRVAPKLPYNYQSLGEILMRLRLWDEADAQFARTVELMPGWKGNIGGIYNEFAWKLATDEQLELRDIPRAVELAEKAVAGLPNEPARWDTLGFARYRNADWAGALDALQQSMGLCSGGDGFNTFLLAMTDWQLGNKDEARKWYDKAVRWTANAPMNEKLIDFRMEAAALLSVPEAGNSDSCANRQYTSGRPEELTVQRMELTYVSREGEVISLRLADNEKRVIPCAAGAPHWIGWSRPDQRWLALVGNRLVRLSNDESGREQTLCTLESVLAVSVTSDGKRVAWCRRIPGESVPHIIVQDLNQENGLDLGLGYDPMWSASDDLLIYCGHTPRDIRVWNGTEFTHSITPKFHDYGGVHPALSPDDKLIAFGMKAASNTRQIGLISLDGTKLRQLTHNGRMSAKPTFSPDGRYIAYLKSDGQGGTELAYVNVQTEEETVVAQNVAEIYAVWRNLQDEPISE